MKKKILITGSTGFVGSNLIKYFSNKFTILTLDRSNYNKSIYNDFNIIIHLAGKAHDIKKTTNFNEYIEANYLLTKKLFDDFLLSNASIFIFLSSVKSVADSVENVLTEDTPANPLTSYGKSKLLAEQYILNQELPINKKYFILRPCMIHGPLNKGNLNLLYNFVKNGFPWPLGSFHNKRSYCSIDNLCFIINELIINQTINNGIYNVADDEPVSTIDIYKLMTKKLGKRPIVFKCPKFIIFFLAMIGDIFHLPLNSERLSKLTQNYIVSNLKIKTALKKNLPITTRDGFNKTFDVF